MSPVPTTAAARRSVIRSSRKRRSVDAPRHPLPKPEAGRYHLIRFVRSSGQIDVFGELFRVPTEAVYAYVRATVDVTRQQLTIRLDGRVIDQHRYLLR